MLKCKFLMLPPYPDVPTAEEIAADAAQRTIAMLPAYPTLEIPAYQTIDLVLLIAVVVIAVLVLYTLYTVRKLK